MVLKIKKGRDLPLAGGFKGDVPVVPVSVPVTVAVCPVDFHGFVPKTDVAPGDAVKAGQPLMHDKNDPKVCLVSPINGTVTDIIRAERRRIVSVVVKADGSQGSVIHNGLDTRDLKLEALCKSGLMAMMRQRPYDIVPSADIVPRDIFVSAFDSAPMAVNTPVTDSEKAELEAGVAFLKDLTEGKVYVSRRCDSGFPTLSGAENVDVCGPHPAGLPGVQAANIKPVNKGETVWTLDRSTLRRIGQLKLKGFCDWLAEVAVTGPALKQPYMVKTVAGIKIDEILTDNNIAPEYNTRNLRIISGNVLTGETVAPDGFLHWPYRQVTVMAEGNDTDQFMGWATMSPKSLSLSNSFIGKWTGKLFSPDARIKGGRRAIIMSGEYDRLLPMDIMLEYLVKAIESKDIDNMEKLGIYEIAPEDVALAEFADSSKLPLQNIVRQGLDYLRNELK